MQYSGIWTRSASYKGTENEQHSLPDHNAINPTRKANALDTSCELCRARPRWMQGQKAYWRGILEDILEDQGVCKKEELKELLAKQNERKWAWKMTNPKDRWFTSRTIQRETFTDGGDGGYPPEFYNFWNCDPINQERREIENKERLTC